MDSVVHQAEGSLTLNHLHLCLMLGSEQSWGSPDPRASVLLPRKLSHACVDGSSRAISYRFSPCRVIWKWLVLQEQGVFDLEE